MTLESCYKAPGLWKSVNSFSELFPFFSRGKFRQSLKSNSKIEVEANADSLLVDRSQSDMFTTHFSFVLHVCGRGKML